MCWAPGADDQPGPTTAQNHSGQTGSRLTDRAAGSADGGVDGRPSAKFMIFEAERRFPVRIRIGVPPDGLGSRLDQIKSWLDANCGADVWAMTPSRTRGVLNDAVSI